MNNTIKNVRYIFFALTLIFAQSIFGQETDDGKIFGGSAPIIAPNSPEASNLGVYGNIPFNNATGQMNYSVPFHTIEVDGNQWPIGLSYNYGGLMLEGKPSLNGLGWSTSGGGAVTREIRGLADESANGYYSTNTVLASKTVRDLIDDYIDYGMTGWSYQTLRKFFEGNYDSEVDKYTVNVGNLNFSFKIGLDMLPYMLSKHANKVEITWGAKQQGNGYFDIDAFTVTDTKGIKYHFSVKENTFPKKDAQTLPKTTTSWNLEYIEYLNGQKIEFFYTSDTYVDYSFQASGSVMYANVGDPTPNTGLNYSFPAYTDAITDTHINRQLLTGISFPKGTIEFGLAQIPNENRMVYSDIALYHKFDTQNAVKWFDYQYSGNRDYLDAIDLNGEVYYQFEYYDETPLPDFIANKVDNFLAYPQDNWGFYNGAGNSWALNIPNSQYSANKESSFYYTRLGALKRIIYPTKGSTLVNYEQNRIKTPFVLDSDYYDNLPATKTFKFKFDPSQGTYVNNVYEVTNTLEIQYPTVVSITSKIEGERYANHILLTIERSDHLDWYSIDPTIQRYPSGTDYYDVAPYLREQILQRELPYSIPPMYPLLIEEYGPDDGAPGYNTITHDSDGKMLMMPGTYIFKGISQVPNTTATANIDVRIFGQLNIPPPDYVEKKVGGVRVSSLSDCPDGNSANCVVKEIDYNDTEGFSTGSLYLEPQTKIVHNYTSVETNGTYYFEIHNFLSNKQILTPVYYKKIAYKYVSEDGQGSAIDNGITEIEFSTPNEDSNYFNNYPLRPLGKDLDRSLTTNQTAYNTNGDMVSATINGYQSVRDVLDLNTGMDTNPNHPWSLKVYKKQDIRIFDYLNYPETPGAGTQDEINVKELHEVYPYKELDIWDRSTYVQNTNDGITTRKDFQYNDNQIINLVTEKDSRGDTLEIRTYYANDYPELNSMATVNQLEVPVQVERYRNGVLMGKSKTEFSLVGNGYKPTKTYAAKGAGNFQAKFGFTYNPGTGNILQVDQFAPFINSGEQTEKILKSTSYIWGYNNGFPVVKVDNATYDDIINSGGSLTDLQSYASSFNAKKVELDALRSLLPEAFVAGFVYKPLIGISEMMDARGDYTSYAYDTMNRLLNIKDKNGKLLEEYDYKYQSTNFAYPVDLDTYEQLAILLLGEESVEFGTSQTFNANITGGSGVFDINWYLNGTPLTGDTESISITFDSGGLADVSVEVTDTITGNTVSSTMQVSLYSILGQVILTPSATDQYLNQLITFDASGINVGSGSLSYEWIVDGNPQTFTGATGFQTSFNTINDHTVTLIVTDDNTGDTIQGFVTVNIYEPMTTPNLVSSVTDALVDQSITFTPSNVSGGSNSKEYKWYIDNNLEIFDQYAAFNRSFANPGTYEIKFVVTDLVLGDSKEGIVNVTVHPYLGTVALDPSSDYGYTSDTFTFSASITNAGSGSLSYQWKVDNVTQTFTGATGFQTSFTGLGDHTVMLLITDTVTGDTAQGSTTVTIYKPMSTPNLVASASNALVNQNLSFTPSSVTGGGDLKSYKWYINGVEQSFMQYDVFNHSFNSTGSYAVKFVATDPLFNHSEEATVNVNIYNSLSIGTLSANTSNIYLGETINFVAPTVSGGSINKSYQWLVDGVEKSTSAGNFSYNLFNTEKSYQIIYRVTDNDLGITDEASMTINAYNPMNTPTISPTVLNINAGDQRDFTTSNIGGGSGSYSYDWYVEYNGGGYSVIPSEKNPSLLLYNGFGSVGTYHIKFRVKDDVVNRYEEVISTVNVYGVIQISNSDITTDPTVTAGSDTYFNINTASGGSGDFSYQWIVVSGSSNGASDALPVQTEANRNVSAYTMGFEYVSSSTQVKCKVIDNITGGNVTVSQTIDVTASDPTIGKFLFTDTDSAPDSAALRLTALTSGGSGQYTYEWYVDSQLVQQSSSNIYEYLVLYCGLNGENTASVTCWATDAVTGQTGAKTQTFTLDYTCGPNPN